MAGPVYLPLSYQREGDPERINRNSLGAMMGAAPLGNAIVLLLCCCVVVSAASPAVIVRWDRMNRTWEEKRGGADARAAGVLAFPHQTADGCLFPRVCRMTRCFCTKRLQFRPFLTKLCASLAARRDGSVPKVSAESE